MNWFRFHKKGAYQLFLLWPEAGLHRRDLGFAAWHLVSCCKQKWLLIFSLIPSRQSNVSNGQITTCLCSLPWEQNKWLCGVFFQQMKHKKQFLCRGTFVDQDIVYSLVVDENPQTLNCILIPHGDKSIYGNTSPGWFLNMCLLQNSFYELKD